MVTMCPTRLNTIYKFYVLPTQCVYVFLMELRKNTIISLYSINSLVCITDMVCLLRGTQ